MKTLYAALLASTALLASPAQAADGAICKSDPIVQTSNANTNPQVTVFPQIINSTLFKCDTSTVGYTFKQLSQQGWIIDNIGTIAARTETNVQTGTITITYRHILYVQR